MMVKKLAQVKIDVDSPAAILRDARDVGPYPVADQHPAQKDDECVKVGHGPAAPVQMRAFNVACQTIGQRKRQPRVPVESFRQQQLFRAAKLANANHATAHRQAKQILIQYSGRVSAD